MTKDGKKTNGIVTLKEVAAALGLSTMTVSRALNDRPNVNPETKKRIQEVATKMGYTPNHVAKSLVSNRTYTIGVVIPEIGHAFFPEVVRGIDEISSEANYQIFLTNSSEDFEKEKRSIEALRAKRVDGILVSTSIKSTDFSFFENLKNTGIKIVFFDRCIYNLGISCIGVNDRVASRQITEHLIKNGYKKIAYLSGPPEVTIGRERLAGFREALTNAGIEINEDRIVETGLTEIDGKEAMNKLLALPKQDRPDAVATVNDPSALGAIEAIKEYGLSIPEDIAIVGFTNEVRASIIDPPLTTINQPAYDVGKRAAYKLLRTIENENEPVENVELIANLVIRKSCGSNS
ncbi:MAG: LacI family DNA-binding transcriptional regulator [Balneolaceae bacterium]|nr:LacI family DNA-binding transcriptional regulator [Balneolaceae bacterium]